jgi:S-adenosylmethionine/arginine decarboxylase-like enzyme
MFKGRIKMIDIKYNTRLSNEETASFVFEAMIASVKACTSMTIVHQHLELLGNTSPVGFTSILLLDESHFSAHSYHEEGLLCCDIFTCGNSNLDLVCKFFIDYLDRIFDVIQIRKLDDCSRFPKF